MAALVEYAIQLAKAFCPRDLSARVDTTKPGDENEGLGKITNGKVQQPPQPAFKRLHLLYLLHDVMMHIQAHDNEHSFARGNSPRSPLLQQLWPLACSLIRISACGCGETNADTLGEVLNIIAIWRAKGLCSPVESGDLVKWAKDASESGWEDMLTVLASEEAKTQSTAAVEADFDWTIPDRHSNIDDADAPWHELPAANGLFMRRTRGFPLRAVAFPNGGYEVSGHGIVADEQLKQEVTTLYKDMLRCYNKHTDPDDIQDVDALGNVLWKDADRPTRNYWGWTLDGIESRKELAAKFADEASGYGDLPAIRPAGVNSAVERAKALAAERNGAHGRQNGFGMGGDGHFSDAPGPHWESGRGGFRGGGRGGLRGGQRGDFRGGYRGRGRW